MFLKKPFPPFLLQFFSNVFFSSCMVANRAIYDTAHKNRLQLDRKNRLLKKPIYTHKYGKKTTSL